MLVIVPSDPQRIAANKRLAHASKTLSMPGLGTHATTKTCRATDHLARAAPPKSAARFAYIQRSPAQGGLRVGQKDYANCIVHITCMMHVCIWMHDVHVH